MMELITSMGGLGLLVALLIIVLWTLLPFAVFGIKDRLDRQIELLHAIHEQLKRLDRD